MNITEIAALGSIIKELGYSLEGASQQIAALKKELKSEKEKSALLEEELETAYKVESDG